MLEYCRKGGESFWSSSLALFGWFSTSCTYAWVIFVISMVRLMRPATPVAIEKGSAIGMKVRRLWGIDRKSKALRYNEADLSRALVYSRYPSSYHAPTSPQLRTTPAPPRRDLPRLAILLSFKAAPYWIVSMRAMKTFPYRLVCLQAWCSSRSFRSSVADYLSWQALRKKSQLFHVHFSKTLRLVATKINSSSNFELALCRVCQDYPIFGQLAWRRCTWTRASSSLGLPILVRSMKGSCLCQADSSRSRSSVQLSCSGLLTSSNRDHQIVKAIAGLAASVAGHLSPTPEDTQRVYLECPHSRLESHKIVFLSTIASPVSSSDPFRPFLILNLSLFASSSGPAPVTVSRSWSSSVIASAMPKKNNVST